MAESIYKFTLSSPVSSGRNLNFDAFQQQLTAKKSSGKRKKIKKIHNIEKHKDYTKWVETKTNYSSCSEYSEQSEYKVKEYKETTPSDGASEDEHWIHQSPPLLAPLENSDCPQLELPLHGPQFIGMSASNPLISHHPNKLVNINQSRSVDFYSPSSPKTPNFPAFVNENSLPMRIQHVSTHSPRHMTVHPTRHQMKRSKSAKSASSPRQFTAPVPEVRTPKKQIDAKGFNFIDDAIDMEYNVVSNHSSPHFVQQTMYNRLFLSNTNSTH